MPERCSSPVPKSYPFREPGMCLIHVYTFQACLSRSFPCLLLVHCHSMQEHATDARPPVQKQCSRGGRNEHGSHLDKGREKVASRNIRVFT